MMLTVTPPAGVLVEEAHRRLIRAGFDGVNVMEREDGNWDVFGTNPARRGEDGADPMFDEFDRTAVEAAIAAESETQTARSRIKELDAKSTMSASEQVEAVKLLLRMVANGDI